MRRIALCLVPSALGAVLSLSCASKSDDASHTAHAGTSASAGAGAGAGAGDAANPGSAGGSSSGGAEVAAAGSSSAGATAAGGGASTTGGAGSDQSGSSGAATGGAAPAGGGGSSSAGASAGLGGAPSAGCKSQQVPRGGHYTIDVGGTQREYILYLPPKYDVLAPTAYRLYILLHGRMFSAQTVVDGMQPSMTGPYYGLQAAAGDNAILVAGQALSTSWTNENGRDVAYINAMIAHFKTDLCVDESRIFGVGFSMGAIMTLTEACDASSVFRAIAPMSASLPSGCSSTGKPLAYWGSHGTNDKTIDISQGEAVRDSFVKKNGCKTSTTPGDRAGCVTYDGCAAGAPVTWCTFDGVHEPPTFAGEAIWGFTSKL